MLIAWIAKGVPSEREKKCVGPDFDQPLQAPALQYIVLFGVVKKVDNKIRRLIKAFERNEMAMTTKRLFIYLFIYLFLSFKAVAVHSMDQVA